MHIPIKYTQLFINNDFINSVSGKTYPVYNPSTEEVITMVQEADMLDVDIAVAAARKAFMVGSEWRCLDVQRRGCLLYKLALLMKRDKEELAKLESLNNGKPLREALIDVDKGISAFEYYAGWTDKIFGQTIPVGDGSSFFCCTRLEPFGVCAQIIPWNYPLLMVAWKLGPALACGNCVVMKPSEHTPLTALYIAALAKEAGFPPGVINILPGYGEKAGRAMALHPDIDKIAFTGSTEVGRMIQEFSSKSNLKRCSLELGGNCPFIIFDDLDGEKWENAIRDSTNGIFENQGQSCTAAARVYVHEKVYDRYIERAKDVCEARIVGDPFDERVTNGPMVSMKQLNKTLDYIKLGKKEGARLVTGGERMNRKGFFVKPVIFADVRDDMKIAREEIFGPVLVILKFKDTDEIIRRCNDTVYGLAAGLYCEDLDTVFKVSQGLQCGTVWINCYMRVFSQAPFGGYKQSGYGRELGENSIFEYTQTKTITACVNTKKSMFPF